MFPTSYNAWLWLLNSFCKLQHRICANNRRMRKLRLLNQKEIFRTILTLQTLMQGQKGQLANPICQGAVSNFSMWAALTKSATFAQEVIQPSTLRASRLYGRARPISTQKKYFCQSMPECKLQVETMELLEIMKAANYLDIRGLLDAASKVY